MTTHDIMAFIRARLVEDEAAARAWLPLGNPDAAQRGHIARHDPARVLAEVDAKRQIVLLHTGEHDCPEMRTGVYPADWPPTALHGKPGERWEYSDSEHFDDGQPCPTLRLLALPYATHPEYRPEWRP